MIDRIRAIIGPEPRLLHAAWLCVLAGIGLSLLGVYAIDVATQPKPPESGLPVRGRALDQLLLLPFGIIAALAIALPHYQLIRRFVWPLIWLMLAVLVFLLIPIVPSAIVHAQNGARSWISIGPINVQPSELAKIAYVLVMADYFRLRDNHRRFLGLVPPAIITLIPVGLITLQPDLGTASLFAPTLFAVLIAAGAKLKHLLSIVLIAAVLAPASYPVLMPHQKARILGMIAAVRGTREGADTINYQRFTADRIAAAGGFFGVGDEKSRALIEYNALPEPHTDMIFPVILNRFGAAGGLGVFLLYATWLTGAAITAARCRDAFGRLVVVGCASMIVTQVTVNIAMTLGLLPIIGITLPFLSYGRSSLVSVWLMTGLIVGVATRQPLPPYRESFDFEEDSA